ncbi:hypothetical protein A2W24_06000 [Microgenomates group bacterium RBG_16_45_19]|nr:MAG: hypothetical protein A2W24_06000 [Microgenomates group bacterium RBG_16_45_19]
MVVNMDSQTKYQGFDVGFNRQPSTILHLDLNSCFATIEQQANPLLRGKPVAVAAYPSPGGCILAASVEAKSYGVKTGLRVKDGQRLCSGLIVKSPDPWKYRHVHLALRRLLTQYTDQIVPKSIDEFVLNLEGYPAYSRGMKTVAQDIKRRLKSEIGDWLTVSIGLGPNRFLAKTAAGLHKPDGLDEINYQNAAAIYQTLNLTDLCGIARQNAVRLNQAGIYTVFDLYRAPLLTLKAAFQSVLGYYWYLKLRGWESDAAVFSRKSYGNSYALPRPLASYDQLAPLLTKLTQKMSFRLRRAGWYAQGVHLALLYRDFSYWHQGMKTKSVLFDAREIYRYLIRLFLHCPYRKPVHTLAVSVFNLVKAENLQLDLFGQIDRQARLCQALDAVNERWGQFVITPARMLGTSHNVPDRIAFGGIKELEEFTLSSENLN